MKLLNPDKINVTLLRWLIFAAVFSFLAVGFLTNFQYNAVDIQLHDTYFVLSPFDAIVKLTMFIFIVPLTFLLVDILSTRYKILALLISIINPLIALFIIIFLHMTITMFRTMSLEQAEAHLSGHVTMLAILIGILVLQAIIQISAMMKLKKLIG